MQPEALTLQLQRLEAQPGDVILLHLPEAQAAPDIVWSILQLRRDLHDRGIIGPIVLCEGESLEIIDTQTLAGFGLVRVDNRD